MGKVWPAALVRPALLTTAVFDRDGRLWLARVEKGHLYVSHSADKGTIFGPAAGWQVLADPRQLRPLGRGCLLASWRRASDHPLLIADGTQPYLSWNTAKEGLRLIGMEP